MIRRSVLLAALLLWGQATPAQEQAGKRCFVFWASQCFEIRDARNRDITHHVLITRGPVSLDTEGDCEATLESRLSVDQRADLLDEFNDVLEDINGCDTLGKAPARVFTASDQAIAAYRRLTRKGSRTRFHELSPPRFADRD